jgi:antitoxin MazE
MAVTISKWGNSLGVRLPKDVLEKARLHEGDTLTVMATEQGLILRHAGHRSLEEMLASVTPENLHGEVLIGEPVGNEVW